MASPYGGGDMDMDNDSVIVVRAGLPEMARDARHDPPSRPTTRAIDNRQPIPVVSAPKSLAGGFVLQNSPSGVESVISSATHAPDSVVVSPSPACAVSATFSPRRASIPQGIRLDSPKPTHPLFQNGFAIAVGTTASSESIPGPQASHVHHADEVVAQPAAAAPDPTLDLPNSKDIRIEHGYDDVLGHRILHLKPTLLQWQNFPAVLAYAKALDAQGDGCLKVSIPNLQQSLPEKLPKKVPADAYKVKQIRKTNFWQVSTVPSDGEFCSSRVGSECTDSVDLALKNLKKLFRANKNRQMRSVRYRVDVPAWTPRQRREAGVPEQSPIHPLKGDRLDRTKAIIPGIHTPYVYKSGPHFGATFQIHAEDFRLASLNHLYKGHKIWIVVPATAVDVAERILGRGEGCSQFMRHRAEFFFPDKLEKLGIPYRLVDQRPGETIVLPDAYHEGFSTGYTIAEAKNYADETWNTDAYQPCQESCRLPTAIPAAFMRPLDESEERLDLCAA